MIDVHLPPVEQFMRDADVLYAATRDLQKELAIIELARALVEAHAAGVSTMIASFEKRLVAVVPKS